MGENGKITHISQLKHDQKNPRKHNPRNIGVVVNSLQLVGAARSIVIDENDEILAGNGVTEAAGIAGIEKVMEIEADGETLIAVRRRGLSEEQKQALKYYDNRASDLAGWDVSVIVSDLELGLDFSSLWNPEELSVILEAGASELLATEAANNPNGEWEGMPEYENEAQAVRSLHVHFLTSEDCLRFCKLLNIQITENTKTVWYPNAPERPKYRFAGDES